MHSILTISMLFVLTLEWFDQFAVAAKLMEPQTPFYLENFEFSNKIYYFIIL